MNARLTAADLRGELKGIKAQLVTAQQRWNALGDDPVSFQQRAHVAAAIADLEARAESLPAAIARAERRAAAIDRLRALESQRHDEAARLLASLIESLPAREQILEALQACATANAVGRILEQHDARPHRPFSAPHDLQAAFMRLASHLRFVHTAHSFAADVSACAAELAILNGEVEEAGTSRKDMHHATT